jgi:flagellar motility protein MotE (MotC chaperone)
MAKVSKSPKKPKKEKKQRADAAAFSDGKQKGGGGGAVFAIVSLFSALVIIAAVLAGFLFFILRTNLMGVADTYREAIEKVPLLNLALPAQEGAEPELEELSAEELAGMVRQLESEKAALAEEKARSDDEVARLRKFEDEYNALLLVNNEKTASLQRQSDELAAEKKSLEDMRYELERLAAEGDSEGFAKYFEGVSPEVAQEIYAQVVQQQQAGEQSKDFIKMIEAVDTKATAAIFETLGSARIDLIVETLRSMKRDIAAEIIAQLTPELAASVTTRLAGA